MLENLLQLFSFFICLWLLFSRVGQKSYRTFYDRNVCIVVRLNLKKIFYDDILCSANSNKKQSCAKSFKRHAEIWATSEEVLDNSEKVFYVLRFRCSCGNPYHKNVIKKLTVRRALA